jgi:hypothetical protein
MALTNWTLWKLFRESLWKLFRASFSRRRAGLEGRRSDDALGFVELPPEVLDMKLRQDTHQQHRTRQLSIPLRHYRDEKMLFVCSEV